MTERILRLADELKEVYKTKNPKELCCLLGIAVVFTDLPGTVSGFYMENGERQAVVINEKLSSPYTEMCMAHELGHALLHKGVNTIFLSDNTNLVVGKYEREADLFAAALLVDEAECKNSEKNAEEISAQTGLPLYAVEMWSQSVLSAV